MHNKTYIIRVSDLPLPQKIVFTLKRGLTQKRLYKIPAETEPQRLNILTTLYLAASLSACPIFCAEHYSIDEQKIITFIFVI